MLNFCGIIRPLSIVFTAVLMLSVLAPEMFDRYWPYLAAMGVLVVPALIYRWWNTRYNPGCSVRYTDPPSQE